MGKPLAVVLDDAGVLSDVCGANDRNLRVLEELLSSPVYSQGNRIMLATDDSATRKTFAALLGELRDRARLGLEPGPEAIRSIYRRMEEPSAAAGPDQHLSIPKGLRRVAPRGANQMRYLDLMTKRDLVIAVGPAGTGKTYLAVADALRAVGSRQLRRMIITRPVVEAGESLGYLPGDLEHKIEPYLRPLYDAMQALLPADVLRRMEQAGTIEVAPLAYMRGRTLADAYVILDEAQNTTREQMKMFLTRMGEGSRIVITGDITQIDLPRRRDSGLLQITELLAHVGEIGFIYFDREDVVRHPLVRKIVQAYETAPADADQRPS